jgi:hypothetical protein
MPLRSSAVVACTAAVARPEASSASAARRAPGAARLRLGDARAAFGRGAPAGTARAGLAAGVAVPSAVKSNSNTVGLNTAVKGGGWKGVRASEYMPVRHAQVASKRRRAPACCAALRCHLAARRRTPPWLVSSLQPQ